MIYILSSQNQTTLKYNTLPRSGGRSTAEGTVWILPATNLVGWRCSQLSVFWLTLLATWFYLLCTIRISCKKDRFTKINHFTSSENWTKGVCKPSTQCSLYWLLWEPLVRLVWLEPWWFKSTYCVSSIILTLFGFGRSFHLAFQLLYYMVLFKFSLEMLII